MEGSGGQLYPQQVGPKSRSGSAKSPERESSGVVAPHSFVDSVAELGPMVGRNRANFGRFQANFVEQAKFGRVRGNFVESCPMSGKIGRARPKCGPFRAELGRTRAKCGRNRAKVWPTLVELGPQIWSNPDQTYGRPLPRRSACANPRSRRKPLRNGVPGHGIGRTSVPPAFRDETGTAMALQAPAAPNIFDCQRIATRLASASPSTYMRKWLPPPRKAILGRHDRKLDHLIDEMHWGGCCHPWQIRQEVPSGTPS